MFWEQYTAQVREALDTINNPSIYALVLSLQQAREAGATVFTCGNGGSASAASHLAQDLSKGTIGGGHPRLRAICLADSIPSVTAWANDVDYGCIFSEQLLTFGQPNDVLIAISGSGNSPNVLNAVIAANTLGMRTWGIVGFDGGELIDTAHRCVHVKCNDMGMVEAAHGVLFHWLVDVLKEGFQEPAPNAVRV